MFLTTKRKVGILVVLAITGGAIAINNQKQAPILTPLPEVSPIPQNLPTARICPDNIYPNPQLTVGKADTLSLADLTAKYNGQTYSQAHRNVPQSEHNQVYNEYNVPASARNAQNGEVDHYYPLCAGGSNDISNLWYQPAVNQCNSEDFGYHVKDKLESWVCVQIKAGKLSPQTAFQAITEDWVKFYEDNKTSIESSSKQFGVGTGE